MNLDKYIFVSLIFWLTDSHNHIGVPNGVMDGLLTFVFCRIANT